MIRSSSRRLLAAVLAALLFLETATAAQYGMAIPSAPFVRPANSSAYSSGQLVANSTTVSSVAPLLFVVSGQGLVRRVQLCKSSTGTTNASFRLHLYTSQPSVANGDGGTWSSSTSGYIGSLDVTIDKAFTDGACGTGVPLAGSEINFTTTSQYGLYGLLEARAAYTPVSGETFTPAIEIIQN